MSSINKISIITLTYKNWRLLDKAIASVNSQIVDSKYSVEYLIVDDGTIGFDEDYVQKSLTSCPFASKIIINTSNLGTVKSFNQAILASQGDLIIPLSADDEFYCGSVLNDIILEFEKTKALIITGSRIPILNGAELSSLPESKHQKLFENRDTLLKGLAMRGNFISGASTYYHREIFNSMGFFDEEYRLIEDYPFYLKVLNSGGYIHFFNRKVIKYGTDGVSAAGNLNQITHTDYRKCYSYILQLTCLNFLEKRFVYYSKILTKKEKIHFFNLIIYPEQFLFTVYMKLKNLFAD